ncbi:MAG: S8 family serine peptidase [Bryobacteraceae bacterium]
MTVPIWRCVAVLVLAFSLGAQTRSGEYAVILKEPPLARQVVLRKDLRAAASITRLGRIQGEQRAISAALAERGVPVLGATQTLLNAVFVRATSGDLKALRALPNVARVIWMPPLRRHLDRAAELVKASAAWSASGGAGNAGAGIRIGILDSGIDHTHPAFQDSSLAIPPGFPKGRPEDLPYTNRKIIVARSYVSQLPFSDIQPVDSRPDDNTPRDRSGHGTATAMIAAGGQVSGPAGTITGIAPKAQIGNYKIFGSPGINDTTRTGVLLQALEDALNDGMDIVILPIGSPPVYGPLDRDPSCADTQTGEDACDVRAQAVENAVSLGLTVVVSGGNDGDAGVEFPTLGSTHTPGTAPSAITVGASTNSHILFAGVVVRGERRNALFGDGPKPIGTLTAPLRDVAYIGDNGRACSPLANGSLAGAIALIERGDCSFAIKVNHAQRAGAVGAVVYQSGGSNFIFNPSGLTGTGIPAALIGSDAGVALKRLLESSPEAPATLDPALQAVEAEFDTVAYFSSHGPVVGTAGIKPELVAVGTDIYAATQNLDPNGELYDQSRFTAAQGTSFSAPMVAGAAAMVKQRTPRLTPAQIKSAVVNTAVDEVQDEGGPARVTAVGAGKLHAGNAVVTNITVEPATLSFGVIQSTPAAQTLRLTNISNAAASLTLALNARDTDNNARLSVTPGQLTLNPGQTGTVSVRLEGSRPAPGSYEGVVAISGGNVALRVPWLYLVGDGTVDNAFALRGEGFTGAVNESDWLMALRAVDRYGVAVANAPVRFRVLSGGGFIDQADATTDSLGIAAASVTLGPQLGEQAFAAEVGDLVVEFNGRARLRPVIVANGVVNAASFQVGRGVAPGSYITIPGVGLSESTRAAVTLALPISLAGVSVSFDAPGARLSLPGRIHFVSSEQINVQIPWEFQGLNSVLMKVTLGDSSSAVYSVPLSDYSPAVFEFDDSASGRRLAAVLDENFGLVTPANPARRGRVVSVYAHGLGPVDRTPPSGEPSSGEPLSRTQAQPVVTLGGRPAQVVFSGLAPFLVGLYQVNIVVPTDAPEGLQPLIITANGIESKAASIPVQ